ncbi:MAG: Nif3-like dinuclear metal center hexameric protein [Defluviitaleaceae bacterium]|nr:Nif3-like dinuclear metal center hexameric protein [Defluviitaleaceae bacterium]
MKANDLLNHVLELSPWVNRETTVDKIIDGNPEKELRKVLVVWRCSMETLDIAVKENYDGIIVHEPTYYFHKNEAEQLAALPDDSPKKETAMAKKRIIRSNDLVVIRLHDSWDSRDEIGVAASWAKSLGLNNRVKKTIPPDCECRYDVPQTTAGELLETIKEAVKGFQIPMPVLFGDPNQVVNSVGLGAGCITNLEQFIKMGCDIAIGCDDGILYWPDISFAIDRNFPVIRVSHAATEEVGIRALADWLQDEFGIAATYMQE